MDKGKIKELEEIAKDMRSDILKLCYACGKSNSHLGGGYELC